MIKGIEVTYDKLTDTAKALRSLGFKGNFQRNVRYNISGTVYIIVNITAKRFYISGYRASQGPTITLVDIFILINKK